MPESSQFPELPVRRGRPQKYSDDDLLDHLRALARRVGHTPSRVDLIIAQGPSPQVYHARFGSLRAAQERAGLKPNEQFLKAKAHG